MYCKNCGGQMQDNQAICLNCGVKKGQGATFCPNCGQPVAQGSEVCLNCGVAIKNTDDFNGYSKVAIALICFFLGTIGIHNFLMGETKKGIFKIVMSFCCGLGSIFALIDFIKILIDKYEINPEKLV